MLPERHRLCINAAIASPAAALAAQAEMRWCCCARLREDKGATELQRNEYGMTHAIGCPWALHVVRSQNHSPGSAGFAS